MKSIAVTEQIVASAIENLLAEADIATGKTSGRARFYGYVLLDDLKTLINEAIRLFGEGKLNSADATVKQANNWLRGSQRAFVKKSEDRFTKMILQLPHLDQDIESSIEKKKTALLDFVRLADFDLDEASKLAWALRDAILRASSEQAARERNRSMRKNGVVVRKSEVSKEEVERAREAQRRHDAERAGQRATVADKFAKMAASL